jgi:hypothetical protein
MQMHDCAIAVTPFGGDPVVTRFISVAVHLPRMQTNGILLVNGDVQVCDDAGVAIFVVLASCG